MAVISSFIIQHYVFSALATGSLDLVAPEFQALLDLVPDDDISDPALGTSCTYPGMAIIFQNILICFRFDN